MQDARYTADAEMQSRGCDALVALLEQSEGDITS
jgi:hypothetical protein